MPKVLDEDQLRRKEELRKKRAARKATKDQESTSAAGKEDSSKKQDRTVIQRKGPSPLLELPDESCLLYIYTFLSAADVGRLLLTCKQLNTLISKARVPILLSRLHTISTTSQISKTKTTINNIQMITTKSKADSLLHQLTYAGGDTGKIACSKKYALHNDFVGYTRFLDEAVLNYSTLSRKENSKNIQLPSFVHGRYVSISPEHSLIRLSGDGVASWGVGKRGQLGHGKRQDERLPAKRLTALVSSPSHKIRIVQIAAGGGLVRVAHSLLLTNFGRVLSFGTGQYGALGHGYSAAKQLPDYLRPAYIEALNSVVCVTVAAGELHSAAVTSDGDVYTWGDGFCGQLGHGDKRPQLTPKQVETGGLEDECVAMIACGSRHTMVVTEEGEVWSWGLGHFGVLGRSFTPFDYDVVDVAFTGGEPGVMDQAGGANNAAVEVTAPVPEPPAAAPQDIDAQVREQLDLIANLSLDDSSDQCYPKLVESLQGIKIIGCSTGHRHSLLLSEDGALYSCGAGNAGCLGHGDTESHMYPMRIGHFDEMSDETNEGPVIIRQMSAGVDISMAVSTKGHVYAWGRTDGGRIGLGNARGEVLVPTRIHLLDQKDRTDVPAVDVECAYVHSLIVGLNGTVHICGGVGVDGEADGQRDDEDTNVDDASSPGLPRQLDDLNVWHRLPDPKEEVVKKEKWKKFGKYEVRGRSKMMAGSD